MVKVTVGDDPEKFFQIGSQLPHQEKEELTEFLRRNIDVFAWNAYEALGVDPEFICHHLKVNSLITPRKQSPRCPSKEHAEAMQEEATKLKQAEAIKEVFYPKWLANTVVVKKKSGKWRVCVDFTDLNRAYPKDPFPMPKIDQLMDATIGYPRCLSRLSPNTFSSGRSGEDCFCHPHREIPLQSNALMFEKCKIRDPPTKE